MRLSQIQAVLRENVGDLQIKVEATDNNVNLKITGWKDAVAAVKRIQDAGVLKNTTTAVLSCEVIVLSGTDPVVVSSSTGNTFNNRLAEVRNRTAVLLEALNETLPDQPPEAVSFKLPDSSSLQQVSGDLAQLEKILSQIVLNDY